MNKDNLSVVAFILFFIGVMLLIDATKGFEMTKNLLGYRTYFCDDTIYEKEKGWYLIDDPSVSHSETERARRCGYKDKSGNMVEVDYIPLDEFEQAEEPNCYFSGKYRYCD